MEKQNFDSQWQFKLNDETMTVDLPHDYSIIQKRDANTPAGPGNGYFKGGVARYDKRFKAPQEWQNKKVLLEFEGVYMNAVVTINRNIVARHPYGYTSFHCDLTPYLRLNEENCVTVHVNNNALPNTRWYSGSGIYRHVWLIIAEQTHIAPYGIFVSTPDESTVKVETTIENISPGFILHSSIINAEGEIVASAEAEAEALTTQIINLPNSKLWSIDNPYLYTLISKLINENDIIDTESTVFGVRTISVDTKNGFLLNGKQIKMKGACVHHDCGLLGAASHDRAEERKVQLLKDNGYNAIRCAHNPPSPAFLDACDRFGILVMDEAFDSWREGKMPFDYSLFFDDWWQRDMTSMILRDRNHPSIVLWSTGNEIPERDGHNDGFALAKTLADFVRTLDNTRPVTNALCSIWGDGITADEMNAANPPESWGEITAKFAEPLDVVGYNYLREHMEYAGKRFPERIIIATETFPNDIYYGWQEVLKHPYVIGDFVWTGLDYLGEAGIGHIWYNGETSFCGAYPWNQAFCGDIDLCGFKRPQSYYRDFVWGIGTAPYIAVYKPEFYGKPADYSRWSWPDVVNSWTWPGYETKNIEIEVYSGGDEVELLLNGESLNKKAAGKAAEFKAKFETKYTPGELIAITYENGIEISRSSLKTASAPVSIRLTPDRTVLNSYGDLSFITVELLDKDGNIAPQADNNITFSIVNGELAAVGNGNPKSEEMYVGSERRVFEGRAMVVVKSTTPGTITLFALTNGLPAAEVTLSVV